ncbi:MAG TPA: hypothetical protein VGF43_23845 [Dongiaceae bacterium]
MADVAVKQPGRQAIWMKLVDPAESRKRAFVLTAAATALTLVGSFLNFLNYNAYPVTSPEALLVLGGLLAASILVGLTGAGLGVFGQMVIPIMLVVVAVQANFQVGFVPLYACAAALLARFARQALILWFAVVTISQLWTAMMGAESRPPVVNKTVQVGSAASATPDIAVVHLVLDEHIGLEGIPESVPGGPELQAQLRSFYLGHGFRIMAGAYSESLHTVNAIPRMLSLRSEMPWKKRGRGGTTLKENRYFDSLQAMGLQIVVAQTDWVDYCGHPAVATCMTRVAGDMIDMDDQLPISDKAALLVYRFTALSGFATGMLSIYDVAAVLGQRAGLPLPVVQLVQRTTTSTLNGMATFDWAIEQAKSLVPGRAIFAHVLLPHYPYSYDANCRVRPVADWLGRLSSVPWEDRYAAYFDQVACATRKVDELLSAIRSSPAAGKTVIIIHGDHGSRITHVDPTIEHDGEFSGRDLVDGHAAFFAVSAPGIEPGYETGRYSLRLILTALVESRFRTAVPTLPADFVPTIQIEDIDKTPIVERPVGDVEWWDADQAD